MDCRNLHPINAHPTKFWWDASKKENDGILRMSFPGEIAALLAHIHTKDDEHRKQGQGKKKCHLYSVLHASSYTQPMKNHLRSG
jgi:hypothetical protein